MGSLRAGEAEQRQAGGVGYGAPAGRNGAGRGGAGRRGVGTGLGRPWPQAGHSGCMTIIRRYNQSPNV